MSQNEARMRAATLLGNPIGGFLFDVGCAVPFLADALSYVISLMTLLLIRSPFEEPRTEQRRHVLAEIVEGVRWLLGQRYILTVKLAASASLIGIVLAGLGIG